MDQVKSRSLVLCRSLAFVHAMVGIVPLLFNVFVGGLLAGSAALLPVGGFSRSWLLLVIVQFLLPLTWAVWLLVLASRLWRPTHRLAGQLLWTHVMVLAFGGLHCVWGFLAIRAAERSTACGGGLLSPVAVVPLFVGVLLVAFALLSLFAARRIAAEN